MNRQIIEQIAHLRSDAKALRDEVERVLDYCEEAAMIAESGNWKRVPFPFRANHMEIVTMPCVKSAIKLSTLIELIEQVRDE